MNHKDKDLYELEKRIEILENELNCKNLQSRINILEKELFLCPADYPYLYFDPKNTKIILGNQSHWRKVDQTLCTFLTSKDMIIKHYDKLLSMCTIEHTPFEKPLHDIFKIENCLSPIPSLAVHFANLNSIFGISPIVNIKKLWEENNYE